MDALNSIDHVAIAVTDVAATVEWYRSRFRCEVQYQDPTWALVSFANVRLAFVIPEQHPAHIGFVSDQAETFGTLKQHRDGTRSCYITDPSGNQIEVLAAEFMPR